MKNQTYLPGFDWGKLIGCIMVVQTHCGLVSSNQFLAAPLGDGFNAVVPLFFMMAGCLSALHEDAAYNRRYARKYGIVYLLVSIPAYLIQYIGIYLRSGNLMVKDFLFSLCMLPFTNFYLYQLWFLPPLIYAMYLNGRMDHRQRERVLVLCIAAYAANTLLPDGRVFDFCLSLLKGILFVTAGHVLIRRRLSLRRVGVAAVCLIAFDLGVYTTGLASVAVTFFLFECILRIRGQFLAPYHRDITIFSGLMFFLHTLQIRFLELFLTNKFFLFVLVILLNALLTWILHKRRKSI